MDIPERAKPVLDRLTKFNSANVVATVEKFKNGEMHEMTFINTLLMIEADILGNPPETIDFVTTERLDMAIAKFKSTYDSAWNSEQKQYYDVISKAVVGIKMAFLYNKYPESIAIKKMDNAIGAVYAIIIPQIFKQTEHSWYALLNNLI